MSSRQRAILLADRRPTSLDDYDISHIFLHLRGADPPEDHARNWRRRPRESLSQNVADFSTHCGGSTIRHMAPRAGEIWQATSLIATAPCATPCTSYTTVVISTGSPEGRA